MNKFVINKTEANLQLKRGYFTIDKGSFKAVKASELLHPDFDYAISKGWIEISDKEPEGGTKHEAPAVIDTVRPAEGMTAAQLKASQEEKQEPVAKSESIGRPADVTEANPEVAEQVVDATEQVTEQDKPVDETAETETTAKRGRRAAK